MLRFSLFGIPVTIQPWFWVTIALLGGALHSATPDALLETLIFMVVAAISILVHEFGHALTGRRLGGGYPEVVLWAFGGLAYNHGGRFTRWQRFWMILMGPGAGFLFLGLVAIALILVFGFQGGCNILTVGAIGKVVFPVSEEVLAFLQPHHRPWWVVSSVIWINLWWGLINLLPVLPLDGGRIAELWMRTPRQAYLLSATCAGGVALLFLGRGDLYATLLFGFLAFQSFKHFQELR
ncbi:site-2 protease family protein [Haloferula sargassicola]